MKHVNEEFHFRAYTSLRRLPGRFSAEVCFVKGRDAIVNLWLVCEEVLQAQAAVELIEVGHELTPPPSSAPNATVLTSSKLRFWHALEGKIKEEKTCRQGSWTVNCKLTTEKDCFFSPEGQSSEIARYAAAGCTDCEKIDRVQSTMYRPEVSRSAQTKKSTQLRVHTLAYLAIKASISARNAAKLCSDLLDLHAQSASARSWFPRHR